MKFLSHDSLTLIIVDYVWYAMIFEEIDSWCYQTFNYHPREGSLLTFLSETDKVCFLLRWD
jgi:hypothetical protein